MTINKSQGQSLSIVGVQLVTPVFAHGQLYVALSRATNCENIYVSLSGQDNRTTNIVYTEVLAQESDDDVSNAISDSIV